MEPILYKCQINKSLCFRFVTLKEKSSWPFTLPLNNILLRNVKSYLKRRGKLLTLKNRIVAQLIKCSAGESFTSTQTDLAQLGRYLSNLTTSGCEKGISQQNREESRSLSSEVKKSVSGPDIDPRSHHHPCNWIEQCHFIRFCLCLRGQ